MIGCLVVLREVWLCFVKLLKEHGCMGSVGTVDCATSAPRLSSPRSCHPRVLCPDAAPLLLAMLSAASSSCCCCCRCIPHTDRLEQSHLSELVDFAPTGELQTIRTVVCSMFKCENALVSLFFDRRVFIIDGTGVFSVSIVCKNWGYNMVGRTRPDQQRANSLSIHLTDSV